MRTLLKESQTCSNQICRSMTTPKQIDEKSIRRSKWKSATWSAGGKLDWWVKERGKWLGRVRGADGRQRWVKAADLRQAKEGG